MKKYTLLLLLVFAFASGGCGGGSSSSPAESPPSEDTTPTVSVELDSDGDGVPDVFGYFSEGYSNGRNAPGNGEAYDVPYLNYIASSDTDEQGNFTAKIYLERGKDYVMKYSHSGRTLGDNDLDFSILTPDEKELAFDPGLSSSTEDEPAPAEAQATGEEVTSTEEITQPPEGETEESAAPAEIETLTVKGQLEILPEENPCMIFYTFTAPQNGVYTFTLREKEYFTTSQDVPYELRIYNADDDSALKLGTITMTPRDVLDLQRVLLSYADEFNADGLPVSFTHEFVSNDVYNTMIQGLAAKSINAARVRTAADAGTHIASYVNSIPYYDKYQPGAGFYADSGLLAATFSAFENFTMPTPANGAALPVETLYTAHEVMTEEEHNIEQRLDAMTTFALADNALGLVPSTATNVRLGQLTKTLMISYEKTETSPRLINPQTLKFNQLADFYLSQGDAQTFREEYGDYFVAGYKWGLSFRASVSVTCTDSNILNNVCNAVSAVMQQAAQSSDKSSASLINTINNLAKSGYVNMRLTGWSSTVLTLTRAPST